MKDAVGRVDSVLVLGGTSEIGIATARALRDRGARRILLAGRDEEGLRLAAASLATGDVSVGTAAFDARAARDHAAFIARVFDEHGDFDLVLLAFGVLGDQEVAERDASEALRIIETNFLGAVSVGIPVADRLRRQGHGTLVVLSSVAGERARRSNFVYGSSKAGLDAFFQGLGEAMRGTGAGVLIVRPGFVRTKMTAGRRAAPLSVGPSDVATAIVKALADGKDLIWVPGPLRWVMAVLRHLPRPAFRQLKV